ncbi:peptide/nickel transport system ATP-binding protein [Saccharopolyspora kobensis]|uniref:Peptide/nickel transport system ATP-binding protein n=1 Tax=Saccharopolyspora kobensis TaxID=146035 RepID=A0A1H5T4Q4_9PSEU|nr:ATP-binding cassette domain-containing protein [Saccharopolyspora kobensis]SEF57790.1 peptide/nickel transport system ATP-binding protein [Saccharopolyspora kobensis]SFC50360.1 peptide/nickel transport system ATP-binding protein [Saccharopolyspora kobensis]
MSAPVLSAQGLHASAGARALLADVDVELRPGEITAVIGASGSGKTTLGLALQGESRSGVRLGGTVALGGTDLLGLPAAQRRAARAAVIGYLPQHPGAALNPLRKIGRVLAELARDDRAIPEALQAASFDAGLLGRYPHQLSGGQQQRAVLAQAVLNRPDVLVLDEPATGLDAITKSEAVEALNQISSRGTAILLLTHDLGLARRTADSVVVLHDGRIAERGRHVLTAPAHDHTRALLAAAPRVRSAPRTDATEGGLRASGLTKIARNGDRLLDGVDLAVPPGRCVAIVGRSGSGKTTLARCLAGLTRPTAGEVLLDGVALAADIRHRDRRQRTKVQYVHQDARASFDEFRPVLAQLARTAQSRAEAERALESVGLDREQAARRPAALSGGQLQRAALARALLARPSVLICDEITTGQDPINRAELLDLLTRTTSAGLVLISHDLAAVAAIADEIQVLDAGRCTEHSPTAELLARPRTAVARSLVDSADSTHGSTEESR